MLLSLTHVREYLRTAGAAGEGVPSGWTRRQSLHPLQHAFAAAPACAGTSSLREEETFPSTRGRVCALDLEALAAAYTALSQKAG